MENELIAAGYSKISKDDIGWSCWQKETSCSKCKKTFKTVASIRDGIVSYMPDHLRCDKCTTWMK